MCQYNLFPTFCFHKMWRDTIPCFTWHVASKKKAFFGPYRNTMRRSDREWQKDFECRFSPFRSGSNGQFQDILGGFPLPTSSMGLVYLPTFMVDFYGKCIGKYGIVPWMVWLQWYSAWVGNVGIIMTIQPCWLWNLRGPSRGTTNTERNPGSFPRGSESWMTGGDVGPGKNASKMDAEDMEALKEQIMGSYCWWFRNPAVTSWGW